MSEIGRRNFNDAVQRRNWQRLQQCLSDGDIPTGKRFEGYDDTGAQSITGTAATVQLDTTKTANPSAGFDLSTSGGTQGELTVYEAGWYSVDARVSLEGGDDTGDFEGYIWLEVDTGSGFTEVAGSRAYFG